MSFVKHGFINIYKTGWYHRSGKPGNMDRQSGDIYETLEGALKHIEPRSHYITTVGISWVDPEDVHDNPPDSVPIPLRETRKAAEMVEELA